MSIFLGKKVIIFDFDGTIVDSNEVKAESFGELYFQYGEEVRNKVIEYHNQNLGVDRFKKIAFFHKNFLGINLKKSEIILSADKFSKIVTSKVVKCDYIPGIIGFLDLSLRKNTVCAINTATPEKEIREILKKRKITKYFEIICGSPNEKSENINIILNQINYSKKQVVCIGDSISDYNAAEKNNIDFIGIGKQFKKEVSDKFLLKINDYKKFVL